MKILQTAELEEKELSIRDAASAQTQVPVLIEVHDEAGDACVAPTGAYVLPPGGVAPSSAQTQVPASAQTQDHASAQTQDPDSAQTQDPDSAQTPDPTAAQTLDTLSAQTEDPSAQTTDPANRGQGLSASSYNPSFTFWAIMGGLWGFFFAKQFLFVADKFDLWRFLSAGAHSNRLLHVHGGMQLVGTIIEIASPLAGAYFAARIAAWAAKTDLGKRKECEFLLVCKSELERHSLPLTVLLTLLIFPKAIVLWIVLSLGWSLGDWLYAGLTEGERAKVRHLIPERIRHSQLIRELSEGVAQARPFLLIAFYVFSYQIAMLWMFAHWVKNLFKKEEQEQEEPQPSGNVEKLILRQNRFKADEEAEANFFHSPAFSITCLAVVGCGIPALLTFMLYQHFGIGTMLGLQSPDAHFTQMFVSQKLYVYSLACCLSVLFIRNWFTFPLNFLGEETRIEIDSHGVKRHMYSWFTQVLTMNMPWAGADSFRWEEVKCIRSAAHCPKLYPLPKSTMPDIRFVQELLNRLALVIDAFSARSNDEEFLLIRSQTYGGNEIKIRLSELSAEERAQLFYALRKWAPENVISEEVQQDMIGSSVLQAPRYTQMWFELLTRDSQVKHAGALKSGTELRDGALQIVSRLASGGQANVYLAKQTDGSEVVLKEFILSTSDAVGSLIESAAEFETETSLLSQLQHSHIVKMLDYFAQSRRLYIVLERIEGESLRQRIKRTTTPLGETEVIEIAIQICEVLQYLHSQNPPVVHRDVTPDNIMLSDSKQIKLIDFSLAAAKKSHRTTSTMGKHCYAPPEQFREEACPQSDFYALGATMYYLLTAEDPKPITPSDLLEKLPEASPRLAEIIKRATAFDATERYQSAEWMSLELKSLLDHENGLTSATDN